MLSNFSTTETEYIYRLCPDWLIAIRLALIGQQERLADTGRLLS